MTPRKFLAFAVFVCLAVPVSLSSAQKDDATNQLARDIYKQLIEINTTDSVGNTTIAAEAMAKRLRDAGYPDSDIFIGGPNPRKGNLVVRLHGTGARKPILLICHLDVVEARRQDWSLDPFKFLEKDGYFYGGTEDIKDGDAILMSAMIRMKQEGYKPDRDIILALTADEEGGNSNGVAWLVEGHPDLIAADFALNPDAGVFELQDGKRKLVGIEAAEKTYQDFELKVTNRGGHSSLPTSDNAIYQLADGLTRLQHFQFPFELNEVTREYFSRSANILGGSLGEDMKAIVRNPPDEGAIARLSAMPYYNARFRTTCVATMLEGGHARNALPGSATANVNCRLLPGHTADETRSALVEALKDPQVSVTPIVSRGAGSEATKPSPLRPDVMGPLEKVSAELWPGVPVVPQMDPGASDNSILRAHGTPAYGVVGVFTDVEDDRSHGKDERIRVASFYAGVDFYYRFLKALSSGH
jgi:acetylornithine deacetylase/succinyl-diaminopimelate desuccinylase-like protein